MLTPILQKIWTLDNFRGYFGTVGRPLLEGPRFDSRCGAPVQHILLDVNDDEDDKERGS